MRVGLGDLWIFSGSGLAFGQLWLELGLDIDFFRNGLGLGLGVGLLRRTLPLCKLHPAVPIAVQLDPSVIHIRLCIKLLWVRVRVR